MKLAVVETSHHGGLLHYAVQLGDALAGRGHDVDLLLPQHNELMGRERKARMRAVLTAPARSSATSRSWLRYLVPRAGVGARLTLAWARIVGEVGRGHYDAVIVGADLSLAPAAVGALTLTALPRRGALVFICHNVRPFNRWAGEELYSSARRSLALLGAIFQRFDLVVVHGDRSRAEFEAA